MILGFNAAAFLGTAIGKAALIASLLAALATARYFDKQNLQNIGAERAIKKIEKANEKATDLGKRAAEKSRNPPPRRLLSVPANRDPTTRDD